ncbi:peptidoglycan-binding protein [Breoghania sp. L-A4]|uniref:glycoside hydrolase family protein n=1 Tax=Breoghania sp. L-A4 TaxID=2304600 RepID=UPI0013C2E4F1|nr:peptidoglycan-binding protein [Breoghania sp. L-A4]
METSPRGRAFIAEHEGVVLKTYRCPAGVLTIGVGHTARAGGLVPKPGMRITHAQAMALLAQDVKRFEKRVTATGAFAAQKPFEGATSFDFNSGRIHNASWVKHYAANKFAAAEASLMQWTKGDGKVLPGLVRRRKAEADLIFRGQYGRLRSETTAGLSASGPSVSTDRREVEAYQAQLKALGFYKGPVDGHRGPDTRNAVLAFQRSHPHLDDDGIVGPATRAALIRAMNLRKRAAQTTAAAGGSGGGVAAADQSPVVNHVTGVDLTAWGVGIGLAVLLVAGAFFAWRYRDEIRHLLGRL